MKKLLFLFILSLSPLGYGAPVISGLVCTGGAVQGASCTITGTGFSTKRNGQILFDNFNSCAIGINLSACGNGWLQYGGSVPVEYQISTANPYIGTQNARAVTYPGFNPSGTGDFGNSFYMAAGQKELYVESAFYYIETDSHAAPGDGNQIKMFRMTTGPDATTACDPWMGWNRSSADNSTDYSTTSAIMQSEIGGPGCTFEVAPYQTVGYWDSINDPNFTDTSVNVGQWHQFMMWSKLSSTQGAADGKRAANIDNRTNNLTIHSGAPTGATWSDPLAAGGVAHPAWDGAPIVTWDANSTDIYHYLHLPFFIRNLMGYTVDIGYVYINDSPERVECHGNSSFFSSSNYQVQQQVSRTSTSITFTFQQGNLNVGNPIYCTVVNSDNTYSTSFQAGTGTGGISGSMALTETANDVFAGTATIPITGSSDFADGRQDTFNAIQAGSLVNKRVRRFNFRFGF